MSETTDMRDNSAPGQTDFAYSSHPARSKVEHAVPHRAPSFLVSALSRLLRKIIVHGTLTVIDPDGLSHVFGAQSSSTAVPEVTIRIHDKATLRKLIMRADLAAGEAYMDGKLTIEAGTLDGFLEICTVALSVFETHPLNVIRAALERPFRALAQYNSIYRSRQNVAHHYDLSGKLYDLFLDSDRQYSCAYFQNGDETLEEAQAKKKRHITAKLLLKPGMKVLDIGSGWGGLAFEIARVAPDIEVTGLTLSEEQLKVARQRAIDLGLADRVQFHLRDYRDEVGTYDRIVSVGMFEHVGVPNYQTFFDAVVQRLTPDGVALLHAIGRSERPGQNNPWINKYIFPGGYCPPLSEVLPSIERSRLWVTDIEILRLHYAKTLHEWSARFQTNRGQIAQLLDERFCRMWEFYLSACEAIFRHGPMMVFQIQLSRSRDAVPLTRDYMAAEVD